LINKICGNQNKIVPTRPTTLTNQITKFPLLEEALCKLTQLSCVLNISRPQLP